MNGSTHMAVGVASSFLILQPRLDLKQIVLGSTLAIMGSLVSDIDVDTSKANKAVNKIIWIIGSVGSISLILDYFLKLKIYESILNNANIMRVIVSIFLFSIVLMFAKMTPHRSFSHSVVGAIAFYVPISLIFKEASLYFLIGIISHIFIDLFNKKKVQLFYPFKHGVCFKLCKANGLVNKILFYVSTIYISFDIIFEIYKTVSPLIKLN